MNTTFILFFSIRSYGSYQGQGGHQGAPPPPQPPPPDDAGKKAPNSAKSAKNVASEDGYYGGYGIDEASLLEGDDFELVGKCIQGYIKNFRLNFKLYVYCQMHKSYPQLCAY